MKTIKEIKDKIKQLEEYLEKGVSILNLYSLEVLLNSRDLKVGVK